MASLYGGRLIKRVLELSVNENWETAVKEWEIIDCDEDEDRAESCICGKEELYYLFKIRNTKNGNVLYPIGSSCIKRFGREDLDDEAAIREKMFKLYHAIDNNQFISLSTELFSRKILERLYHEGAFNTEYNHYDGSNDYEFMLKMFNKRDKSSITMSQQKKIRAIIVASIRPYLRQKLADKAHHC